MSWVGKRKKGANEDDPTETREKQRIRRWNTTERSVLYFKQKTVLYSSFYFVAEGEGLEFRHQKNHLCSFRSVLQLLVQENPKTSMTKKCKTQYPHKNTLKNKNNKNS